MGEQVADQDGDEGVDVGVGGDAGGGLAVKEPEVGGEAEEGAKEDEVGERDPGGGGDLVGVEAGEFSEGGGGEEKEEAAKEHLGGGAEGL